MRKVDRSGSFLNDRNGAVTIDWLVITVALVGLVIAVLSVISAGPSGSTDHPPEEIEIPPVPHRL